MQVLRILTGLFIIGFTTSAHAALISWTDWTASDLSSANGTVGGISIDFTGRLQFAQLAPGVMVGGGANPNTNYWTEPQPGNEPYTGNALVDNAPTANELLSFAAPSTNRISFGAAVTNPLMAIVSQGRLGVSVDYDFDSPFTVLSEGRGFWGDGFFSVLPGDILRGNELHAVIQFNGTFTEINFASTAENWHGFTIGLAPQPVPEPATLALLVVGLLGLMRSRRVHAA